MECYHKLTYFLCQLEKMSHVDVLTDMNLQKIAEQYLLNDIQLSQEEIVKLKEILSGS